MAKSTDKWTWTSYTKWGAITLCETMRDKFGCKILSKPKLTKDGCYQYTFTAPKNKEIPDRSKK